MDKPKNILNPKQWVKTYSDQLYRFAFLRLSDRDIAKDIVQDTFLAALRNQETYKGEISEKNWLFTILKNKIIDQYRKKATSSELRHQISEVNFDEYFDKEDHWKMEVVPKEWTVDYSGGVESKEFFEILHRCIDRLGEIMKSVFSMKYLDEIESEDICKELKISSSNYWVIIHRAKLQLRNCLEKNWFAK